MSARFSSAPFASWIATLAALGLAACQTFSPTFTPVPAPTLAVGDHWQYRITDNLRLGLVTMLDAEVVSVNAGTATLRLVYNDQNGRTEANAEVNANGGLILGALKGRATTAIPDADPDVRFSAGAGQDVATNGPDHQSRDATRGADSRATATVQGQTVVTVPAGTFNATYVYRIIQLDDEQFWRTRTSARLGVVSCPR